MKKTCLFISFCAFFLLLNPSPAFASYSDVATDSPYKEGIDFFELIGAVDSAELFHPDQAVSKAEFYKILFKVFDEEATPAGEPFTDVQGNDWFAPYASLAYKNGLETGPEFHPAESVQKGWAMQKLLEAYGEAGGIIPWKDRERIFKDIVPAHPYYSVLAQWVTLGILEANPTEKIEPYKNLSRGELAELCYQIETWHLKQEAASQTDFYKSDIFGEIWNRIMGEFYLTENQSIDPDALFQAAVRGMLESLGDPYSVYFSASESENFENSVNGQFEGIGAYLGEGEEPGSIVFTKWVEGSPAAESGLELGDQLVSIDGVTVEGMSLDQVISRIKGAAGTQVTLTVLRDGQTLHFTLTRAPIQLDLVAGEIFEKKSWLITINSFGATTDAEMSEVIQTLRSKVENPKAIIIDLRGNGGGYVGSAANSATWFAPKNTPIVTLDYSGDQQRIVTPSEDGPYYKVPLYILVDAYTASASEIMTQSLKEIDSAVVIGTQTFGKGSAQTLSTYWDGSTLKLTIAHWLSSAGTSIHEVGITPNVIIDPSTAKADEDLWLEKAGQLIH